MTYGFVSLSQFILFTLFSTLFNDRNIKQWLTFELSLSPSGYVRRLEVHVFGCVRFSVCVSDGLFLLVIGF